ncbi:MAG: SDR family NAD(P)-dependent oxidoreductase [Chloroflexi bacterium]|nr:SDR family NAD(P)-dependent oxidoreductase [Chloroflexota bacterium]
MKSRFTDQIVLVAGASGGLGSAFARAFAAEGAQVILAGRNLDGLQVVAAELNGQAHVHALDVADAQSQAALHQFVMERFGRVDVVVNAAGADVRKPLADHTPEEIQRLLDVNLRGAILLTQNFLPEMRARNTGSIIHVGGFADGRLAFPFYSVDAATRAGLFTFIEAVNRELRLDQSQVQVGYFSPSPAETEAERPFHPIWREMGVKILPTEVIAADLLTMIAKRRRLSIMGGVSTRLFAGLNAVAPSLADALQLDQYGRILKRHLVDGNPTPPPVSPWLMWIGVALVVISTILYGGLLALPFLSISTAAKLTATPLLILFGEVTFWVGGAMLGKEVVARYKQYLNPCNWFCKPTTN